MVQKETVNVIRLANSVAVYHARQCFRPILSFVDNAGDISRASGIQGSFIMPNILKIIGNGRLDPTS